MKTLMRLSLILVLAGMTAPTAPLRVEAAQRPATARVMREKLVHSQKILEAILTSNYSQLEQESAALAKVTKDPAWMVLRGPEYLRQSEAFLKVLGDLQADAKQRNLDAAAERYTELTMTCFRCHRYMKDQRVAR
jgi:hypothetical protein